MGNRLGAIVTGLAALGGCAAPSSQADAPQEVAATRYHRAPVRGLLTSAYVPRAIDQTPMTVVAMLGGPSVSALQEAAARKLTRAEKAAAKAQRVAEQAAPRARIEAIGGTILGSFQSALNGLKLRIPRGQLEALRQIPGVVDVKRVITYTHDNFVGVQRVQAPFAWAGVSGVHGEGIKVAIIDTGIDYTHANFGGPGTRDAFDAAFAASTQPADPTLFGPGAPKVKGGIDLVGDGYDADGTGDAAIPVPDPNPLDCNGHGSHVAGTAAGFGVLADGTTYRGPYDQLTHPTHSFAIGPGVAPAADLYAIRVFGCSGSTNMIAEALEWAVDNDMDVVNMSLGAALGTPDSADAVAADSAVSAGVVVVAAVGNDGDVPYIQSSPASSTKSIAVAATSTPAFVHMANLALPAVDGDPARTSVAIDADAAPIAAGALPVLVLRTGAGISLGCDPAEFVAQGAAGKLVVVERGVCARVAKVVNGQRAGAAAVVMINTTADLPPLEGPITSDPDTGEPFVVTIPFFGVRGPAGDPSSDGLALTLRDGASIDITEAAPRTTTAAFSSGGPRIGDSALKPDIAAPGDPITSTLIGSGTGGIALSGTSMATPFVTGIAALALQAHPRWKPAAIKSAIIDSGNPDELVDYATHRVGTGLVNAASAVGTLAYAFARRDETTLNFGLEQFSTDLAEVRQVKIKNDAAAAVTFNIGVTRQQGSPHQVTTGAQQITVPAHGEAAIDVEIHVPAATAGRSDDVTAGFNFHDVAGLITFTPATASMNRGITLRVPYYLVPRPSASVSTEVSGLTGAPPFALATITNDASQLTGTANVFAWGLSSPRDGLGRVDLRAAGVQAFDDADGKLVVFAINMFAAWSTAETEELDVLIDVDGDGAPDFDLFSADFGRLTTGAFSGEMVAALLDLHSGALRTDFDANVPTDSSTALLAVLASSLGLTPDHPRFTYTAQAFDLVSPASDAFTGTAQFNAFTPSVTNAVFITVAPNTSFVLPITIDPAEFAVTPARGLMMVSPDNKNGPAEAQLIELTP